MAKEIDYEVVTPELEEVKKEVIEIKSTQFKVLKKEDTSAILNVCGWRMRVYFDENLTKEQVAKVTNGKYIAVDYIGDLEDVFSVKLQKLVNI